MICARCIYDDHIPYISFDGEGVCSYCRQHEQLDREYPTGEQGMAILRGLADEIRKAGKRKKYDVVIGVSGGCDSSYVCHLAKEELGLRPLAAHFDNTWNSRIAVENLQNVLGKLEIDLFTHVVDNKEFCDLVRSFLRASVPDIDIPSDIALATTHYLAARKFGIGYIFEGHSFRTEGISPHGWFYMDGKYIESVHDEFGTVPMKTFPNLRLMRWLKWVCVNRIKKIRPLYYVDYDKERVKELLSDRYGWQWYGGHHMENRTAYFANNYYLPRKFEIDLRFCEFSALVRAGRMTRDRALQDIAQEKKCDPSLMEEFIKRLDLGGGEFDRLMALPKKSFRDYRTYKKTFERLRWLFWLAYKMDLVPKSFYLKFTRKYD
jgi:N-acetyl sugar amidotransferase